MNIMEVLNGVFHTGKTEYVVSVTSNEGTGVFGTCLMKSHASEIVRKIGEYELALLKKKVNEKKTNIICNFDETSYTIETQELGIFLNGSPELYCKVYFEEVSIMVNIQNKFEDELKAHPLAYKDTN